MKRLLSVVLALTLCMGLSAPALAARTFTDVPADYWAYDAIQYVTDEGLFSGTSGSTFTPGGTMTRAMLWVVLARMDGVDTSAASGEAWYQTGLDWAVEAGISDGTDPNGSITRAQFAAMLYRYAEYAGADTAADTSALGKFTDASSIPSYAAEPLAWAVTNGIVSGTSATTISPSGSATRAQVATMLMRYAQKFGDSQEAADPGETEPEQPSAEYTMMFGIEHPTLEVGESSQALVTVVPSSSMSDLTFTFKSSDTSVATVRATAAAGSAVVTAVGPGTAIITATDSNGITKTATVTVTGEASSETPSTSDDEYAALKDEIIALTNEVRAENGVAPLSKSDLIMEIAQQRAEESAEMQKIDHRRPDGTAWTTILDEHGFDRFELQYGENLAQLSGTGKLTAERVVDLWENSTGHFLTMIASNKTFIGIGMARGEDGKYYCSMILTDAE